jgi:hypothetical protein
VLSVRPFDGYLHRVFAGEATMLSMFLRPVEGGLYRLAGVRPDQEQDWYQYALSLLVFHVPGMLVLYLLLRLRDRLPLNPAGQTAVARSGAEQLDQFRHQHELAVIRPRVDAQSLVPDGGDRSPEPSVGGGRDFGGGRADPRVRPP